MYFTLIQVLHPLYTPWLSGTALSALFSLNSALSFETFSQKSSSFNELSRSNDKFGSNSLGQTLYLTFGSHMRLCSWPAYNHHILGLVLDQMNQQPFSSKVLANRLFYSSGNIRALGLLIWNWERKNRFPDIFAWWDSFHWLVRFINVLSNPQPTKCYVIKISGGQRLTNLWKVSSAIDIFLNFFFNSLFDFWMDWNTSRSLKHLWKDP